MKVKIRSKLLIFLSTLLISAGFFAQAKAKTLRVGIPVHSPTTVAFYAAKDKGLLQGRRPGRGVNSDQPGG